MSEIIQCPNCSTAYHLRPDRVHPGIKCARCLRCGTDFSIEDTVRLLSAQAEDSPPAYVQSDAQPSFDIETENGQPIHPLHPLDAEVTGEAQENTLSPLQEEFQATDGLTHVFSDAAPDIKSESPADSFGGADPLSPQNVFDAMASSMSIAEPGDAAAFQQEQTAQGAESTASMELESQPEEARETMDLDSAPQTESTPSMELESEPEEAPGTTSVGSAPRPESASSIEHKDKPEEAVRPGIISEQETPRLKIRMEDTLREHLTMEELAAMAEDGRLHKNHLVAYQSSDIWIEASKVPALRPIYGRLHQASDGHPDDTSDSPPKRSFFKGLFNRN